ncbi:glycosyltransferase family 2 protein [Arthrobacter sp. NPDC056493]|uniref:glycosyltransferase family 2 protein n=1 Tax=Arthrobacter sp. NPDC056493 TaxID=3345839 RepID=UPI00366D846A
MTSTISGMAVVIVHYNSHDTMRLTLDDLSRHFDREHLVVVDNSATLTEDVYRQRATVLADGENRGYAGGVNHGIRAVAKTLPDVSEILVCTHEALFRDDALSQLHATAKEFPGGHIIGPKLVTRDYRGVESVWSNGGHLSLPFYYPKHDVAASARGLRRVKWVDGAAFVIDLGTWRRLGGIPEEFFMYMEDVALGLLARRAGVPVLTNLDAIVEQSANGPSRSLAIRNRIILALRYMRPFERMIVRAEVRARSLLARVHPSPSMREKAMESNRAVSEGKAIVSQLAPLVT